MATIPMTAAADRTLAAAAAILGYAIIIGFTDNFVRVIAADAGLWQFHALRGVMAMAILGVAARPLGLRLAPRNLRAVAGRSLIHGCAMLIYFGCLAFLPVATVAAGLFTAPIFVLLISRFAFGHPVGPYRIAAVLIGFLGVILVLGPASGERIGAATVLPVAAGALYALGNLATREWCAGETAETLLAGFFVTLGRFGVIGMVALALWPVPVPEGAAGFVLRGATVPTGRFLIWTFVQAAGSLIGVGLMIRAYQIAAASRVAIFEYVILPASALWSYLLWAELVSPRAALGMGLIFLAGLIIVLRRR
ncbi:MAG: DMT family transporter [Defluviimonas denitrificans]